MLEYESLATSCMSIPLRVFDTVFNNNINLVELCHALCCIPVEFRCDSVDGSLLLSVYLVLSHRINHHHTETHRAQQVSPFERRDVPMVTANTLTMIINYCSSLPGLLSAGEKGPACIKNSNWLMMRNKKIEEKVQISKSDIALKSVVLLRGHRKR